MKYRKYKTYKKYITYRKYQSVVPMKYTIYI